MKTLEVLLAGAVVAGSLLGCASAQKPKDPEPVPIVQEDAFSKFPAEIRELERLLKEQPDDKKAKRAAGDAYFTLAQARLEAHDYGAAGAHASRALELAHNGGSYEGVDDRIGGCNEILGVASLRAGDTAKGADYLRKGYSWSSPERRKRIAQELFAVYRDSNLLDIVREFQNANVKEGLLAELHAFHSGLAQAGKSVTIKVKADSDVKKLAFLYSNMAEHVLKSEYAKPAEQRDSTHNLEYLFRAYMFGYQISTEKERTALLPKFTRDYALTKKVYPSLPSLQESFKTWHEKHDGKTLPASAQLLEALQKIREF